MKRRSLIACALAAPLWGAASATATAATSKVTLVASSHPDDETLRLATYAARTYAVRGDTMILLACSSGGGSSVARGMGWSSAYERDYRMAEQASAWSALTGGTGQIVRMGLWDRDVETPAVLAAINAIVAEHPGSTVEAYAASHFTDRTGTADDDHRAVARAVRDSNAAIKRYALEPGSFTKGNYTLANTPADVRDVVERRVKLAVDSYAGFGQKSASSLFRALVASGYQNKVVQK